MPPFISRVCSEQESILDGDNHPFDNFLHVVRYESSQFLRLFVFRTIGACLTKRVMRIKSGLYWYFSVGSYGDKMNKLKRNYVSINFHSLILFYILK
mgnify:CR=1 FL=1